LTFWLFSMLIVMGEFSLTQAVLVKPAALTELTRLRQSRGL